MTLGDVINGFVRIIFDILIRLGLLGLLVYTLLIFWQIIQVLVIGIGKLLS